METKGNRHSVNYIFIVLAGIFVFCPCLFDFFLSDDFIWIKRGASFSLQSLLPDPDNSDYNIFRPVLPASFFLLHRLFGLSPYGYHFSSILLHVLNGLLFYRVLSHFAIGKHMAVLSSLIFVSHFAHEETIFWISSISIPLCCLFYLSSILTFLKWLTKRGVWLYFLSLGLGAIAFFIREDTLTLPLILLIVIGLKYFRPQHIMPNGPSHKKRVALLISVTPFFLLIVFYLKLRNLGLPHLDFFPLFSLNPANLLKNVIYFSVNLMFPIRLIFDIIGYQYSITMNSALKNIGSNSTLVVVASFGIALLVGILFTWIKSANNVFRLLGGILLIIVLPYLLFQGYGLRFTYFPALGFSLVGSYLILSVSKRVTNGARRLLKSYVPSLMIVVLVFNFLVLFERHLWWRRASKTCEETIKKAGAVLSSLPAGSTVYFMKLPFRSHGAYILNNGFPEALSLFYPTYSHRIKTVGTIRLLEMEDWESHHLFEYEKGEFRKLF